MKYKKSAFSLVELLIVVALIAVLAGLLMPSARAATTNPLADPLPPAVEMPPPPGTNQSPQTTFVGQVGDYFTTLDTNSTTWGARFALWIGADYVQGLNTAQALGISYDVFQSTNLQASITRGNNLSGYTFGLEATERNAGIDGTILTAGAGPNFGVVICDLKLQAFVEGGYDFAESKPNVEFGGRADKAVAAHTFAGVELSYMTTRKGTPSFDVHTGFTF